MKLFRVKHLLRPLCLGSLLMCLTLCGCAAASVLAYKLSGPPTIKAKYIPAQEPMLVLVESFRTPSASFVTAEQLAAAIVADLTDNKVVPLVDQKKLYQLRDTKGEQFHDLSIPEIGQATGAKQILYVNVLQSSVDPAGGGEFVKATVAVRVKVVDVATGNTLWPDSQGGVPVAAESPLVHIEPGITPASVRDELVKRVGTQVGRLLHDWKAEE
ncbi:MAG: hypothetical protein IT447_15670 [Phycisphaerales bacterium]|nr:hypothetical protein [Phycisphaerales bacterium]